MNRTARRLLAALPPDFTLTIVDVGSAGGLNPRWRPFEQIISAVLFDPREPFSSGGFGPGQVRTYPVALGDQSGSNMLHLTAMANMSSFLEPDPASFSAYGKKVGDSSVVATEQVPVERLDALARSDGFLPDVLKVDTQGSELQVLAGAEEVLHKVLLAEIEVSFFRRYKSQPLFADVERYMIERGFELIDVIGLKRYRTSNSMGIRDMGASGGQRSGRLAYANAIFVAKEEAILKAASADGGLTLLRAVIALLAYRKADMAARLIDLGQDALGPREQMIGNALRALFRSERRRHTLQSLALWLGSRGH